MMRKAVISAVVLLPVVLLIGIASWSSDSELFLRRSRGRVFGSFRRPVVQPQYQYQQANVYYQQAQVVPSYQYQYPQGAQWLDSNVVVIHESTTTTRRANNLEVFLNELEKSVHAPGWKRFLQTDELRQLVKKKEGQFTPNDHAKLKLIASRFDYVRENPTYLSVAQIQGFGGTVGDIDRTLVLATPKAEVLVKKDTPTKVDRNFLQSAVIPNTFDPKDGNIYTAPKDKSESVAPKSNEQIVRASKDLVAMRVTPIESKNDNPKVVEPTKLAQSGVQTMTDPEPLPELESLPEDVRAFLNPIKEQVAKELDSLSTPSKQASFELPTLDNPTPLPQLEELPKQTETSESVTGPVTNEPSGDVTTLWNRQQWQELFSPLYSYLARR